MQAWNARIESEDKGFELHVDADDGTHIYNIHGCVDELWDSMVKHVGPWLLERDQARAEYDAAKQDPYADLEDGPWPGESVQAFYERTGQDGPLREVADAMNKARKEA